MIPAYTRLQAYVIWLDSSNHRPPRPRRGSLPEQRGGGQPARARQGRQEEEAEEAEDTLHQSAAAGNQDHHCVKLHLFQVNLLFVTVLTVTF